jgi:hypothetical protein
MSPPACPKVAIPPPTPLELPVVVLLPVMWLNLMSIVP